MMNNQLILKYHGIKEKDGQKVALIAIKTIHMNYIRTLKIIKVALI